MPIPLACDCGARLKVRDEAAGRTVKCPKCQAALRVPQPAGPEEPELKIVDEPPAPEEPARGAARVGASRFRQAPGPRAPRRASDRPGLRSSGTVAWEIYVVMGLLVLAILGAVKEMVSGKGSPAGIGMSVLMFLGLFKRSNWGWWLTSILSGLGLLLCLILAGNLPPELADSASFLKIAAAVYAVIIGLLISCRVRGAYL